MTHTTQSPESVSDACGELLTENLAVPSPDALLAELARRGGCPAGAELVIASMAGEDHVLTCIHRLDGEDLSGSLDIREHCSTHRSAGGDSGDARLSLVLVSYGDAADMEMRSDQLQALALSGDARILDRLVVWDGVWRSVLCSDEDCCPASGRALRADPVTDVQSGNTDAGQCDRRLPYSDGVRPPQWLLRAGAESESAEEFEQAIAEAKALHSSLPQDLDARLTVIDALASPREEDQAALAAALANVRLRDGLLRMWLHEMPDDRRAAAESFLQSCAEQTGPRSAAPVLTALAGLAWRRDDPALARLCVSRALEFDRTYSLARLLARALDSGVPSRVWVDAVAATSMRECLLGS